MGSTTNMKAETTAVIMALRKCTESNLQNIILETDLLSLKNIVFEKMKNPLEAQESGRGNKTVHNGNTM